ncbi:triose-phosphate isomerase [candidate division TA06 bacterium]|nr:triose-phosphate isomerase [candidate division TA06 bacterium]
MRNPIIVGNWKMNLLLEEATHLALSLVRELDGIEAGEVVICPPYTSLSEVSKRISGSSIRLGAQNMHWEDRGAYTGEISPQFLLDIGCQYVIIGHSERRQQFGETGEVVNRKAKSAVSKGIIPIVCVGETLFERKEGKTEEVVRRGVEASLKGISREEIVKVVIAYEPVWAIGTGNTASPEDANAVHRLIRQVLTHLYDEEVAQEVRIQYGGSVTPENIEGIMKEPEIDGALVGGASIQSGSFVKIIKTAMKARSRK